MPVPSVAAVHDLMHRYEPSFPEVASGGRAKYRDYYISAISRSAIAILVDSELGKRQMIESYGTKSEKLHVLPYTAPNHIYHSVSPSALSIHLPEHYILYPARFWAHKNHKRLILALEKVRRRCSDVHLALAGSKDNGYGEVERLVKSLALEQHVTFLGYVPDEAMPKLYDRARALIFPTLFGPTNLPPLEAFARGCPVAASGIYAMPDQLADAALLFDPRSENEIADAIYRLWTDPGLRSRLAAAGRQRARILGPERFRERLHSLLTSLTGVAHSAAIVPACCVADEYSGVRR
jgi:glycosyltransferase involved in cell wall biosynthesis